jgi:hypothetical protein
LLKLADPAIAHQLTSLAELAAGALLGPELENALFLLQNAAQHLVFLHGKPQWLLHVHVFVGASGGHCHGHVPMVGRRDEHSVNVLPRQQLPEVSIGNAILVLVAFIDLVERRLQIPLGDIANGHHLRIRLGQGIPHNAAPLRAHTNAAHHHAVAGRRAACLAQGRGRDHGRKSRSRQRGGQIAAYELPT